MNLTERERTILQFAKQGLSDYRIARKINTDPPSVTRSRKNANRKLMEATTDLEWAAKIGVKVPYPEVEEDMHFSYQHFLVKRRIPFKTSLTKEQ